RQTHELSPSHEPVASYTPEKDVADRELAAVLARAIDALPEGFREVFMLRVVQRLDVEETARSLDLREGTVKTRLHRARRMLRAELEQAVELSLSDVHRFLGERCDRVVAGVLARITGEVRS